MLSFHSSTTNKEIPLTLDSKALPPEVNWIDALRPDAQEIAFLERTLGIEVPTLTALSQIQSSSRLRAEKDWLHMSISMIRRAEGFMPTLTPLGFILSKDLLLTVRFKQMKAFDDCKDDLARFPLQPGGLGALFAVLEVIIDYGADIMEGIGNDLDNLSEKIFGTHNASTQHHQPREDGEKMRGFMRKIGRNGDLTSKIGDLLWGLVAWCLSSWSMPRIILMLAWAQSSKACNAI
jgi:magnesium transporter